MTVLHLEVTEQSQRLKVLEPKHNLEKNLTVKGPFFIDKIIIHQSFLLKKQASQVSKTFGLLQLFTNVCWNQPFVMSHRVMIALSRKWRCTTNWNIKTVKPVSIRLSAKPSGKHQDEHILNGRLLHILATYCPLRRGSFKGTHLGKHRRNTVNVSPGG